jgi:hypothetical protein
MNPAALLTFGGLIAIVLGQRALAGEGFGLVATWLGVGALLGALALRGQRWRASASTSPNAAGHRLAARVALLATVGVVFAVGLWGLGTDAAMRTLGVTSEGAAAWTRITSVAWIVAIGLALPVLVAVDAAARACPHLLPMRRVRHAVEGSLAVSAVLGIVVPLNDIATLRSKTLDLAYFKVAAAGEATKLLVTELPEPVTVRLWFSPASEVLPDVREYFTAIEGERIRVEILDHASEPRLSKALKVRSNGFVSITLGEVRLDAPSPEGAQGEGPAAITRVIEVGEELDQAKRKLRRFDEEVQKILRELALGKRVALLTTGHGELSRRGNEPSDDRKLKGLVALLEVLGFELRTLDANKPLADGVPDDVDLVLVLGPSSPFFPAEVDALERHLDGGGALLLALEPSLPGRDSALGLGAPGGVAGGPADALTGGSEDPMARLLARLGVRLGDGVLAAERGIVPIFRNKLDRLNLVTDRYAVHPTTSTVSKARPADPTFFPSAGFLEIDTNASVEPTVIVRSLDGTWADQDFNLERDVNEEAKGRPLAAVAEGGAGGVSWRALVVADSGFVSDAGLSSRGNRLLVVDALQWLIGSESLIGTTESEEDVKIQHSREGQAGWFYGTVLSVPGLVLLAGWLRVRRRARVARPNRSGGGDA